jgi:hypothetical protein
MEGLVENPQKVISQIVTMIDTIFGSSLTFSRSKNLMKLSLTENVYHLRFYFQVFWWKKVEKQNVLAYIRDRATIFGFIPTLSMPTNPIKPTCCKDYDIFKFI